ncbi:hypothetical protein SAMN06297422_11593 [Lachnospiraceae bacterium]|nr:hypothetical protein SAMN06297422_11593 [Lachnospiraceae bacterium]
MNDYKTMQDKYKKEFEEIENYATENGLIVKVIEDKLYVLSEIAYWKILYLRDWDCFILFHGNYIPTDLDIDKYENASYHFQKDAKQSETIMHYLDYIRKHDDYRENLLGTVEDMPRRTRKQKNRYAKMKANQERYNTAIVLQLINAISMTKEMRVSA